MDTFEMSQQAGMPEAKVVQLTEEALLRLLNEAKNGGGYLPPSAYRDRDGVVYRDVNVPTGRVKEIKDAAGKVIRRQQVVRKQQRLVLLVADPSKSGLIETMKKARRAATETGPDVYHPRLGWVRCGTKRETDVAENLGTGSQAFEMDYIDIEGEGDIGTTSAVMQGVPIEDDAPASSGLASFEDAIANDEAQQQEPAPSGRRKGN